MCDPSVLPVPISGSYGPLPLFSLGPKVPKNHWLGTRSCPTSWKQPHLFAWPEHHVILGHRRQIEHACQLGWFPVPTQQLKYPQAYMLNVFKSFYRCALHIEAFLLDFAILHHWGFEKGMKKSQMPVCSRPFSVSAVPTDLDYVSIGP